MVGEPPIPWPCSRQDRAEYSSVGTTACSNGNNVEITLLQIAQVMSMSDGSISEAEQQLLAELPKRVGFESNPGIDRSEMPSMAALASQLISHGDRCTAARVACLIAGVAQPR